VTIYAWRERFGKLEVVDVKRLGFSAVVKRDFEENMRGS